MTDEAFKQALRLYQNGQYADARRQFERLVNAYPHHSEIWLNLGNADFKLHDDPQAEKHWRHALAVNPLEANAYLNLGNLYFSQERWRKAIEHWEQFTSLKPSHVDVWLNLGIACEKLGDLEKAAPAYARFMDSAPMAVETAQLRNRFASAQKAYDAHLLAAESALSQGELQKAKQDFERAFANLPGCARAHKAYAALLYKCGAFDDALTHYQAACRLNENDPVAWINLGVLHERHGDAFDACWAYYRALDCDCERPEAVHKRLQAILSAHPDIWEHGFEQAKRLRVEGNPTAARQRYTQLRHWPNIADEQARRLTSAEDALAVETNPTARAAATAFALGEEAFSKGRYDQAMSGFARYLELAPHGARVEEARTRKAEVERLMGAVIHSMLRAENVSKTVAERQAADR